MIKPHMDRLANGVRKVMKRALQRGGMRFLNRVLASRSFLHSTLKPYCIPMLAEAMKAIIKYDTRLWHRLDLWALLVRLYLTHRLCDLNSFHEDHRLQVMYRSRLEAYEHAQQAQAAHRRSGNAEVARADCLEDLMSLVRCCSPTRLGGVACLVCGVAVSPHWCWALSLSLVLCHPCPQITQLCRMNADVASAYWENRDHNISLFVPRAGSSMGTSIPFMTVFLDMLSAMALGPMVEGLGGEGERCVA